MENAFPQGHRERIVIKRFRPVEFKVFNYFRVRINFLAKWLEILVKLENWLSHNMENTFAPGHREIFVIKKFRPVEFKLFIHFQGKINLLAKWSENLAKFENSLSRNMENAVVQGH